MQALFPEFEWTELSLPARYFSWRVRGNPLSWAITHQSLLQKPYDLILATSMVDLACLRGLRPELCAVPAILYFHENQFAYPTTERQSSLLEAKLVSLYSSLSAERVIFNTCYNRETFLCGVDELIDRFPDEKPANIASKIRSKSICLPVGIEESDDRSAAKQAGLVNIVWNHRWEYDKGPERLLACLEMLREDLPICVHVLGQQFRQQPKEFSGIRKVLLKRGWLGKWGYVNSYSDYLQILSSSHLVISTAIHDFQGLALLEAVEAGCIPLVPNRLAYPEIFPLEYRYESHVEDVVLDARSLGESIAKHVDQISDGERLSAPSVSQFHWSTLKPAYQAAFESLVAEGVSFAPFNPQHRQAQKEV